MAKDMSNNDIVAYEGGDYGKIMDNYNLHEITAAIANRAGKAYNAFKSIEEEVEEIKNNPDVVDIVATYADLQAYPTGQLTDKDVIRVLQDENHDGDSTYYRWSTTTQTWTYIGESKQYSDFVGTDGTAGGQNGLVPAPVATDAGKFLNANGSWEEVQAGPAVVQTTGTSTADVMSQNAVTGMVYADPGTKTQVRIGGDQAVGSNSVSLGRYATARGTYGIAIGYNLLASGNNSIAIGNSCTYPYAIALGAGSHPSAQGEMNIAVSAGSTVGYNNSEYRLLSGLYDGQSTHDAATKGQLDSIAIQNAGAPTTSTTGSVGQLLEDTTNGKLYICTAVDTTDPQNPSYTWVEVGASGGGITELTSADYNYPTSAPTAIGIWNLAPGLYYTGNGVNTKLATSEPDTTTAAYWFIGTPTTSAPNNVAYYKIDATDGSNIITGVSNKTTGAVITAWTRYLTRANVLNTTGTNTAYPMSQNAVTSMVFSDPATQVKVKIGKNASSSGTSSSIAIGYAASATGNKATAVGSTAVALSASSVTIGEGANANGSNSVALGASSISTTQGEVSIGGSNLGTNGYNNSQYRLLTNVYDPQSAHDAATKGYVDSLIATLEARIAALEGN